MPAIPSPKLLELLRSTLEKMETDPDIPRDHPAAANHRSGGLAFLTPLSGLFRWLGGRLHLEHVRHQFVERERDVRDRRGSAAITYGYKIELDSRMVDGLGW